MRGLNGSKHSPHPMQKVCYIACAFIGRSPMHTTSTSGVRFDSQRDGECVRARMRERVVTLASTCPTFGVCARTRTARSTELPDPARFGATGSSTAGAELVDLAVGLTATGGGASGQGVHALGLFKSMTLLVREISGERLGEVGAILSFTPTPVLVGSEFPARWQARKFVRVHVCTRTCMRSASGHHGGGKG